MRTATGCLAELRCKMHGRKPSRLGKIGESDTIFEMRTNIFLDAPDPPLRQSVDGMSRQLKSRDVHDQGFSNALHIDAVARRAVFDQRLAEQFGKRVTDNEIVQLPYRLSLAGSRCLLAHPQIIGRYMEVNEVAWSAKLGG